jgi:hypothetical protein
MIALGSMICQRESTILLLLAAVEHALCSVKGDFSLSATFNQMRSSKR